jgi:alpha-glucosidase
LKLRPNERPFILSRASYAGGQRYAALWPGDNTSDWAHLRGSIPLLLGMGLSGFPFVGSDIGGFAEAPTAELFTRWLQAGVFYPFMRDHTMFDSPDQEPWAFGPEYEALNRRAIELRYQLLPYIYSAMRDSAESGIPSMRPLMLDFFEDEHTYGIDDEFLFGSDLLIAPVLREAAAQRGVYLPAGDWYDYWTGQRYAGGKWINVPVTLASIPIFVRGGGFVFAQPVVQNTGEMAGQPLLVTLFPSASSERWLYEDGGNGFDYKRGGFARRRFSSRSDTTGVVVEIGSPEGAYRPQARAMLLSVRSAASSVQVGGVALPNVDDLQKVEQGWSAKDGVVTIKLADRFERTEIRIQ